MILIIIFPSFRNYPERYKLYCKFVTFNEVEKVYIYSREIPEKIVYYNKKLTVRVINNKIRFFWGVREFIKKNIRNNKDIVIINHFINITPFLRRYRKYKNIKVITKFYFPNFIVFNKKRNLRYNFSQKSLFIKRSIIDIWSLFFSDIIIGNSDDIKKLVKKVAKLFHLKRNIITFPTPVDNNLFHPMKTKKEKNYHKLLFVGNLLERKGIFDLIEVAKLLRDANIRYILYLVGGFNHRKLEKDVNSLISKYELISNIKFIGKLKQKELVDYYNNCDLFIFPSYYEGSPRVVKEAMACGLPVVSYNIEGIKLIDGNKNIIQMVEIGNIKAFFQKIKDLLDNREKLKTISERGVPYIRDNFSIDAIVKKEIILYKKLIYENAF